MRCRSGGLRHAASFEIRRCHPVRARVSCYTAHVMEKVPAMPNRATVTVPAHHLPEEARAALPQRPIPGTRYRVTVEEIEETDEEKRDALRRVLQERRESVAAGNAVDGEEMFARLRAKHFPHTHE